MEQVVKQYVFSVHPERKAYPATAPCYFGMDSYGCGVDSVEEARECAARYVATYQLFPHSETGRFRVVVKRPCDTCRVTGIKPGCKRKACPTCDGRGTTEHATFEIEK